MTSTNQSYRTLIETYLSGRATAQQVAEFDRLYDKEDDFRAMFEQIEQELAASDSDLEPVVPPDGLLDNILAEIDQSTVTSVHAPPTLDEASRSVAHRSGRGPEPWRTISIISSLAAAIAIGFHLVPSNAPAPEIDRSPVLALMTGEEAPSLMVIVYDIEARRVLAKFSNTTPPEDAVWQLWLVRDGNDVPISLGLMNERSETGAISIVVDEDLRVGRDVLAISLEPLGGSQQAGPSGPVLFTGQVEAL
ncbi:MAG: anti-sigma factor [Henriciella sp.]